MHVAGGIVWGFREIELLLGGGLLVPPALVGGADWIARIEQWDIEELRSPMYQYRTYRGDAPDAFAAFTMFDWRTRLIRLQVKDQWVDIEMIYESGLVGPVRTLQRNFLSFESMTGFRLRNHTAGNVAKYQLIAYR